MVSGHCVLVPSGRGGARLSVLLVPMQTCHELLVHVRCCRVLAAELLDGFAAAPKPPDVFRLLPLYCPLAAWRFLPVAPRFGGGMGVLTSQTNCGTCTPTSRLPAAAPLPNMLR